MHRQIQTITNILYFINLSEPGLEPKTLLTVAPTHSSQAVFHGDGEGIGNHSDKS